MFPYLETRGGGRHDSDGSLRTSYLDCDGCLWCLKPDIKEITAPQVIARSFFNYNDYRGRPPVAAGSHLLGFYYITQIFPRQADAFFWLGENRPCRFSRDAKPGFVVRKLKASLVKRALFLPRFFFKKATKNPRLAAWVFSCLVKEAS